jgi:hypothetical protein
MHAVVGSVGVGDSGATAVEFGDVGGFRVTAERRLRVPLQVRTQQALELRLVEHVGLRMPVAAAAGVAVELDQHPQVRVEESQPQARSRYPGEFRPDPKSVEDPIDLVVEVDRPGLRVDVGTPVQDQARDLD